MMERGGLAWTAVGVILAAAACATTGPPSSQVADPPATAAAADPFSGSAIPPPAILHGTLGPGEEASHAVTLRPGQRLRIRSATDLPALWLRFYSPAGDWIGERVVESGTAEESQMLAETGGDYRLVVSDVVPSSPGGAYRIEVELVGAAEAAAEDEALEAAAQWLRGSAYPILGAEPDGTYADLEPLRSVLAEARVTALGEATHGSREFQQMGHRLAEFLVRELGYTLFALETSQLGAEPINDYVLHGKGDPAAVLRGQGFSIWDTADFAALIEWMRQYNLSAPPERQVRFAGFDFQYNPGSREALTAFLRRVAPARVRTFEPLLEVLTEAPDPARPDLIRYYTIPDEQKKPFVRLANELLQLFERHRALFIRRTSEQEFARALERVRLLVQLADAHGRGGFSQEDPESAVATRDRYMAENLLLILEREPAGTKIFVYTHTEHARREPYRMGHYLSAALGKAYYAIGISFDRGGFRALKIDGTTPLVRQEFTFGPAFQDSMGWFLRRTGVGDLFVDFRNAPDAGPAEEWLRRPRAMRSIGFGYSPGSSGYYRAAVVPGRSFDGIIFIERITPSLPNRE